MNRVRSTLQYDFSKGMTKFKQEGYDATIPELGDNLIGINIVDILDREQITKDVCINALSYFMFLKRKIIGDVKVKVCPYGRPQSEYILKEESSSTTMSIYALFISCAMDVIE